jgi:hypothetical protein
MDAKAGKIALFRYGLIAPLVLEPLPRGELTRRAEEIAARHYEMPASQRTSVSVDTLLDWALRYRNGGFEALAPHPIPYPVETVHNAAVVKHRDEYVMLFRSHLRPGRSIIGLPRSCDGFQFTADPEPFLTPAKQGPFSAYEEFGVEDPRVTLLDGNTSLPIAPIRATASASHSPEPRTSTMSKGCR